MELEIAGMVDRPSVDLPVTVKLQRLLEYQDRWKSIEAADELSSVNAHDECFDHPRYFGDLIICVRSHGPDQGCVKLGHVTPVTANESVINWWTFFVPSLAGSYEVDVRENVLLAYSAEPFRGDNEIMPSVTSYVTGRLSLRVSAGSESYP